MNRRPEPDDRSAPAVDSPNDAINLRLYRRLVALIATGNWSAGSRLPSSRALAADSGVSRTTASLALDRLVADGWAIARPRSGLFVAAAGTQSALGAPGRNGQPGNPPVPFELSQGAVDCFPHARWSKIQSRVWAAQVPDALYDADIAGDHGLRSSLARLLLVTRGIHCSAEDILIVSSTRAALALAGALLSGEVTKALVEDPGYGRGGEVLAAGTGAAVAVAVDRDGLRTDLLPTGKPGTMVAFVTPAAQFPTGAIMSEQRRRDLTGWCVDGGQWLFEDDYDWDARFDGERPPAPLKAGAAWERTFYCQSLSRSLYSSLRMAVLLVPPSLRERAIAAQEGLQLSTNLASQLVLAEFIDNGSYTAHLRRLREEYRERREALAALVRPYLGRLFDAEVNAAGLRLVLRCTASRAEHLATRLREQSILCSTLSELSAQGIGDDGIAMGFAAFPVEKIRACREQIARAFES